MSSVVIGSFEIFLGNHGSAVKQAIIGLELIEKRALYEKFTVSYVEDEIISAFGHFDIQVMSYIDPRTAQQHDQLREIGSSQIEDVPG
jgi:hypothetical protein